ncbi:TPA: right-handed parallel beta-helix repeat-containing protein [Serratia fonticola]
MSIRCLSFLFFIPLVILNPAHAFSSIDIGEAINKEVLAAKGKQITIKANEPGEIKSTIKLGVGQVLEFSPGIWTCSASPCIVIDNASQVIGAGIYRTQLKLTGGSEGPVIQSVDYKKLSVLSEENALKIATSLEGDRKSLPGVKYIKLKDITIDGADGKKSAANGVEIYGLWFWLEDVSIERFSGDALVTQFIPSGSVHPDENDAMESYFTRVKLISNKGNGWTMRGPHDSIVSGMIVANNGGWGIDVRHKEGYYSGGGLMLTNTHLYANGNGMRTESGANILAYGIESEANKGVGLLLRSNDSLVQGTFYANKTYGVQIGDDESFSGVNHLNVQLHNNKIAQLKWGNSAGYNMVNAAIFPNDPSQKFFENKPSNSDYIATSGPNAIQQFPGGILMDSDRNVYGVKESGK